MDPAQVTLAEGACGALWAAGAPTEAAAYCTGLQRAWAITPEAYLSGTLALLLAAGVRRLLALLLRRHLLRLGGRERAAARRCLQLCHHSHGCACTHARARSGPRVQRPARVGLK